jgi:hypothetical protein
VAPPSNPPEGSVIVPKPLSVARRWSSHPRLSAVLAAGVLASVLTVGAGTAAPAPVAAAVPATWYSVETYYLKLVNCTRTGGWVRADGSCSGYGSGRYSRYVAPLRLSAGVSNVSRAWAKRLAVRNLCTHGDPGARLRAAGYTGWNWGENIGCGAGTSNAYASVLASHLAMQREKATGGGHWKNIKNAHFKVIGIGVWKDSGRVRVVSDFYTP